MKNFNSMPDDYNTSQSNLVSEQQAAASTGNGQPLAREPNRSSSSRQLVVDEMSQDLTYLSREAPLDGGESTFGAANSYSQLAGAAGRELEDSVLHMGSELPETGEQRSSSRQFSYSHQELEQLSPDNVDIQKPLQQAGFLVSFMVDARGGAMRGCRHSGVRVIIPPNSAQMPMRITCRYLRRERLVHPPPLMEGEACASKIMEVGPAGAKFLGPVLIEVPHFASLRGKEREIIILRSDSGEVWREHLVEADDRLVEQIIRSARSDPSDDQFSDQENRLPESEGEGGGGGGGGEKRRLTRIITNEFPQYFAIISRIRQEVHAVGPEGSTINSQVVPRVQAIFTEGALTKRIKIGLQAQAVPNELVMKHFGSLSQVTFSPIVSIEPRRRKFHCPIRLKVPLPAGYRNELSANLHLLCSITGGQNRAVWEDVTGSTPLSLEDDCLVFTTTVSARFWLVHCRQASQCAESTRFAKEIYQQLIAVPFMAKFVVFAKRRDINEANMRVFCMTDDKEERTLEVQEHYTQVARSRDVEVLECQRLYLEFGGNLVPTHLSGARGRPARSSALLNEQLYFAFRAFQENRLAFAVRLKEVGQEPSGRVAFMEDSLKYLAGLNAQQRAYLNERRRRAVCTLGVLLPAMCVNHDSILGTPKRNSYYASARIGELSLADIAQELEEPRAGELEADSSSLASSRPAHDEDSLQGGAKQADWLELAPRLGIPRDEVEFIAGYCEANQMHQRLSPALILLMHWYKLSSPDTRDQDLARGLLAIGRTDIARKLNFPIEPKRISRSTMELLREIELIPVRSSEDLYAGSELGARSRGASLRRLNEQQVQRQQLQRHQQLPSGRQSAEPADGLGASRGEWIQGDMRDVQVRVEQTTYLESKPATGKKQRRRIG